MHKNQKFMLAILKFKIYDTKRIYDFDKEDEMKPSNAKIYAPFNALKGLYETLEKQEIYREERRELSDDQLEYLNFAYSRLHPGMYIEVTYYDGNKYITGDGTVADVRGDGSLSVFFENASASTEIGYEDVYDIQI